MRWEHDAQSEEEGEGSVEKGGKTFEEKSVSLDLRGEWQHGETHRITSDARNFPIPELGCSLGHEAV